MLPSIRNQCCSMPDGGATFPRAALCGSPLRQARCSFSTGAGEPTGWTPSRSATHRHDRPAALPEPERTGKWCSKPKRAAGRIIRAAVGATRSPPPTGTCSALTKRALVDGDCESFPLKRCRRAGLGKSAGDVAVSKLACLRLGMPHSARNAAPLLTRSAREFRSRGYLAPQTGFEPITVWLTAPPNWRGVQRLRLSVLSAPGRRPHIPIAAPSRSQSRGEPTKNQITHLPTGTYREQRDHA